MKKPLFRPPPTAKQREKGQSLVEFAISAILLLTLLSGAVDFGIALYSYVSIRDAAQEGALFGSINPTDTSGIEERVWSSSDKPVDLRNDTTVTTTVILADTTEITPASAADPSTEACEGDSALIRVEVDYVYPLMMPILPDLLGVTQIPLHAEVTDAILQPHCP